MIKSLSIDDFNALTQLVKRHDKESWLGYLRRCVDSNAIDHSEILDYMRLISKHRYILQIVN